ncbi:class I SAM-dependent methyltransferase [Balneolales bacterium ANBcel1]|nr:class I SAM-dependent methyltransferase [Balneolales bacterium ANBcel1]
MNDPQFESLFFELYESLPRQGPGNRASAEKALEMCAGLPEAPKVLDMGCGTGAQTCYLAEMTGGTILAMDNHTPFIEQLNAVIAKKGFSGRVKAQIGDMARPELPPEHFDLIWSEGALYSVGLDTSLPVCHKLLRPGGRLVFTEAIWRKDDPPAELKAGFEADYPTMGRLEEAIRRVTECGFELIGHFMLPDEAWWDDFYTPMKARIQELRTKYAGEPAILSIVDEMAREPELHKRYSDYYAYEYIVARKPQ